MTIPLHVDGSSGKGVSVVFTDAMSHDDCKAASKPLLVSLVQWRRQMAEKETEPFGAYAREVGVDLGAVLTRAR